MGDDLTGDRNPPEPEYHQLTMFHTAEELRGGGVGKFLPSDLLTTSTGIDTKTGKIVKQREPEEEGWERKLAEADEKGLTEHIEEHGGVERPIDLSVGDRLIGRPMGTILNGHHRIAAQHDINPDALMPVTWSSRMHAGSGDRSHYQGHVPEDLAKENWSREDDKAIGYKPFQKKDD
jgi:hypothetical protein